MDKTKEDFLNSFLKRGIIGTTPWPSYDHIQGRPEEIYRTMQAYADQEKRKEAIAILQFISSEKSPYGVMFGDQPERFANEEREFTSEEIYDLYLQSLQPNTQ